MNLLRDAQFGLRLLLKDKYVTLAAITTLALCIGGNASIFTMLNTLLLKPLPFHEPDRIVEIYNTYPEGGLDRASSNIPILLDYSENTEAFNKLALIAGFSANYGEDGSPERINGHRVTADFFEVIGVAPEVGSFFTQEHMIQGQHRVVVLGYSFWRNQFAADPNIAGSNIQLNGNQFEIRGVAPRSVESLYPDARLFTAFAWNPDQVQPMRRHSNGPRLFGRLEESSTIATAKTQIDVRDRIFYDAAPQQFKDFLDRTAHESQVVSLQEERVRDVSGNLYLLQGGALFALAIGCVNIANLLLIRSNARQSEFAIRCSVGALPLTIGRQLMMESLLLSIGGSLVGVVLAFIGIDLINTYAMDMLPPMQPLALDVSTLFFALGLAILTGLIVGTFPMIRAFTLNLVGVLSHSTRGSSTSRASRFTSSSLVCLQVSISLVLLAGAGLLIHSFYKLLDRDLGFDPENVTTLRISLSGRNYREPESVYAFQNRLLEMINDLPRVDSSGIAAHAPMATGYPYNTFNIFGYEMAEGEDQLAASHTWASPGYFESLSIEIIQGEGFGLSDVADARRSVVIDKVLADRYYPGENPIGRRIGFVGLDTAEDQWPAVIGVAETAQHRAAGEIEGAPFMYENIYQRPFRNFSVFIKSSLSPQILIPIVRERMNELDPRLPIFLSGSLADFIDDSLNGRRAVMLLLTIFAGIAVLLSSIGIYGVLAYNVSQQSREIGTRAAIGANRQQIRNHFLKQGLIKTLIGLGMGLVGALALSRLMASMLYEVQPTDAGVFLGITLILFVVSMLASYLPTIKATRIHPMEALRAD